jgi:hypothetical protein
MILNRYVKMTFKPVLTDIKLSDIIMKLFNNLLAKNRRIKIYHVEDNAVLLSDDILFRLRSG